MAKKKATDDGLFPSKELAEEAPIQVVGEDSPVTVDEDEDDGEKPWTEFDEAEEDFGEADVLKVKELENLGKAPATDLTTIIDAQDIMLATLAKVVEQLDAVVSSVDTLKKDTEAALTHNYNVLGERVHTLAEKIETLLQQPTKVAQSTPQEPKEVVPSTQPAVAPSVEDGLRDFDSEVDIPTLRRCLKTLDGKGLVDLSQLSSDLSGFFNNKKKVRLSSSQVQDLVLAQKDVVTRQGANIIIGKVQ